MDHIQTLTEHKKIRITGYLNNDPIWIYFVVWIKVVRKKKEKNQRTCTGILHVAYYSWDGQ